MDTLLYCAEAPPHWRKCRLENLAEGHMKNLRWTDGFLKRTLKKSTLTYQASRQIMLKDKAQPTVVDELSGRIDEVDENR
jgi:hypothetical protein